MPKLVFIYSEATAPPDNAWDSVVDFLHSLFPMEDEAIAESLDAGKDPTNTDLRCLPILSTKVLIFTLNYLGQSSSKYDKVTFITHGASGQLELGGDTFTVADLSRFPGSSRDFFNDGCAIKFNGCQIADGVDGESFLVNVGKAWLARGGGTVSGYTVPTFQNPVTRRSAAVGGQWVTANIAKGGTWSLTNASQLDGDLLRRRKDDALRRIKANPQRFVSAKVDSNDLLDKLADVDKFLAKSDKLLFWANAARTMNYVEGQIDNVLNRMDLPQLSW
jgi:hypothetical protein